MEQENTEVSQCSTNADQEIFADSVSADPEVSTEQIHKSQQMQKSTVLWQSRWLKRRLP
jgi:hypothetical protein